MALATLDKIKSQVRLLTRSSSLSQLSDQQITDAINNVILYTLPNENVLFNLRTTFTFYTQPGVDTYSNNTTDVNNALYNFKNKYVAIHPPCYMAGIASYFTQWRDEFYGYYPQTNTVAQTGLVGNGTTGPFTGTAFARPMLQNNVVFNCLDTSDSGMVLIDYPVSNTTGALGLVNEPQSLPSPYGQINYITGEFTVTFPGNTKVSAPIYIENIAYQGGRPSAMLYYNDKFTLRPVPDKVYTIQVEADMVPSELISSNDTPEIEQWWLYISYLAARFIFEQKQDLDSVALQDAALRRERNLVNRRSLRQQSNERTQTIYTTGRGYGSSFGSWPY